MLLTQAIRRVRKLDPTAVEVSPARTARFSSSIYDVSIIKRAAYRFADVAAIDIWPCGDEIECIFNFRKNVSAANAEKIISEFKVEVLDQDLRSAVATETAPLRNAILAYAFSRSGLQGGE
jgi:His-Xaa-Ser system protein HxsD